VSEHLSRDPSIAIVQELGMYFPTNSIQFGAIPLADGLTDSHAVALRLHSIHREEVWSQYICFHAPGLLRISD
jgi:hypothetical protein